MTYCKFCGFPETEGVMWEDGICGACTNYGQRSVVNWKAREKEKGE